jgi:hypothetical protein
MRKHRPVRQRNNCSEPSSNKQSRSLQAAAGAVAAVGAAAVASEVTEVVPPPGATQAGCATICCHPATVSDVDT